MSLDHAGDKVPGVYLQLGVLLHDGVLVLLALGLQRLPLLLQLEKLFLQLLRSCLVLDSILQQLLTIFLIQRF